MEDTKINIEDLVADVFKTMFNELQLERVKRLFKDRYNLINKPLDEISLNDLRESLEMCRYVHDDCTQCNRKRKCRKNWGEALTDGEGLTKSQKERFLRDFVSIETEGNYYSLETFIAQYILRGVPKEEYFKAWNCTTEEANTPRIGL